MTTPRQTDQQSSASRTDSIVDIDLEESPFMSNGSSVIITIDGPAGTGKSTVAHLLARRLGLDFLDTGAMYRAAALVAIEEDVDPSDGAALAAAVARRDMHFDWGTDPPRLLLAEQDVSDRIRDLDVSGLVSVVAAQPELRSILVEQQRSIAQRHPRLVTEGRDQGSVVFPDAEVRFFLIADEGVRAQRRVDQLRQKGKQVEHEEVQRDLRRRDELDASRPFDPLTRPEGAVDIDTSTLDADGVVDAMEQVIRERLTDRSFRAASEGSA